jgi:hypothetical protein
MKKVKEHALMFVPKGNKKSGLTIDSLEDS